MKLLKGKQRQPLTGVALLNAWVCKLEILCAVMVIGFLVKCAYVCMGGGNVSASGFGGRSG